MRVETLIAIWLRGMVCVMPHSFLCHAPMPIRLSSKNKHIDCPAVTSCTFACCSKSACRIRTASDLQGVLEEVDSAMEGLDDEVGHTIMVMEASCGA